MSLGEVLKNLPSFQDEATIIAKKPWTLNSEAAVCTFDVNTRASDMESDGLTYFLEVSIARELRDDLVAAGFPDEDALCQRIIDYAVNDA